MSGYGGMFAGQTTNQFTLDSTGVVVDVSTPFKWADRRSERRGRGGLMTPSVTQVVEESHSTSSRSIRRQAAGAIKAIREEAERGHLTM